MALKQDIAKLKRLIDQKDRTEFIQEFIKFKDTYFNKNFKQASIAIGESREKVGGIFDRAGVPQGGEGSLLTETTTTPKNVTKIQDLTTRLKYEPDFLKNQKKFKNLKGKYTAKDIGNLLEVDTSTKRNIDDLTATLKELGVKSSVLTGAIKEYDIKDTINKMSTGFLDKRVKGDVKDKTIRRGLEKKSDPNLHRFFESLKGQIRSSSKEAGVYVPRANEDIGHSMSVVLQDKYPKLFKNSNINTLSTFMYQDPVVNATVLTKTGYDSNFDKILKDLNKLVNKPVTAENQKKLLNLKKQLDTNHKSVINLIKNPDQLKSFLSKYPETFNVKGVDFNYLKGQEKRIPKIDIKIPSVGEVFKSENLYADMSNTDPAFRIGNVDQINSNARTLKDLNLNERQLFRENVINQNVDNLSRFYTAVGFPKDEVVELTDTLITGGERSQGLSGTKSGIEKIDNSVNAYVKKVQSIPGGCQIVVRRALGNKGGLFNETCETIIKADPERAAVKLNNAITATKGPLKDLKEDSQKMMRLLQGEEFASRKEYGKYLDKVLGPPDDVFGSPLKDDMLKKFDKVQAKNITPLEEKIKYNNDVGAFETANGDVATQEDLKLYAEENPMEVKVGTEPPTPNKSVLKTVGRTLAKVGTPLPTALIDGYFINKQMDEGKSTAEIAKDPLNWIGLAAMEPLSKVSGVAEKGGMNAVLRLGLNPATIRGISRFAGLPGLAISTAMTAYDQYKKYQNEEGFVYNLFNKEGN